MENITSSVKEKNKKTYLNLIQHVCANDDLPSQSPTLIKILMTNHNIIKDSYSEHMLIWMTEPIQIRKYYCNLSSPPNRNLNKINWLQRLVTVRLMCF